MEIRITRLSILLSLMLVPSVTVAQGGSVIDQLYVSYIYAAVMGSGNYTIENRQISMLRIPFAYTQRELTEEQSGLKWKLPVTIGYDSLNYPDWLSRFIEDELATLTLLPGVETFHRVSDHWIIKPFTNMGASYDFSRHETILMAILGIRALGCWTYADTSEIRVGSSARYATEYQLQSDRRNGFTMLEVGADYRRDIKLKIMDHATNTGVYCRTQFFLPEWRVGEPRENLQTRLHLVHEIGASIGLRQPRKILGIPISRIRAGISFGDHMHGWTVGTDFPF